VSGPLTWWANRKSKLGLSFVSKEPPPHAPGKPWWTSPPVMCPQPEHIEYAASFMADVMAMAPTQQTVALQAKVAAWLRKAKNLFWEEYVSPERGDFRTTDGLLIAAEDALHEAIGALRAAGVEPSERIRDTRKELGQRNRQPRGERAAEACKFRSVGYVTVRKAVP
jgi:hypothetical protein